MHLHLVPGIVGVTAVSILAVTAALVTSLLLIGRWVCGNGRSSVIFVMVGLVRPSNKPANGFEARGATYFAWWLTGQVFTELTIFGVSLVYGKDVRKGKVG